MNQEKANKQKNKTSEATHVQLTLTMYGTHM